MIPLLTGGFESSILFNSPEKVRIIDTAIFHLLRVPLGYVDNLV